MLRIYNYQACPFTVSQTFFEKSSLNSILLEQFILLTILNVYEVLLF